MRYGRHTYHKTSKKRINPTHDQRLRNHHRHIPLHHPHHALHRRGIRHRVRRRLASALRIFEKCTLFVGGGEIVFTGLKGGARDGGTVGTQVNATQEGALFPECGEVGFFGGGGQERGCVVAENTCENLGRLLEANWEVNMKWESIYHDDCYGEQDPVAVRCIVSFVGS